MKLVTRRRKGSGDKARAALATQAYSLQYVEEREQAQRSISAHFRCHSRGFANGAGLGLPIPYAVPNASPRIERFMRTLRHEALDHFIFLSVDHVRRVVTEFTQYYNGTRPSHAIHGIPDPHPELMQPPPAAGTLMALPVLGGVQHDFRLAA